jgi:hypothetical protein
MSTYDTDNNERLFDRVVDPLAWKLTFTFRRRRCWCRPWRDGIVAVDVVVVGVATWTGYYTSSGSMR